MRKHTVWFAAIGIGLANAVLLYVFEFVGIDVTAWLWNDVLHTQSEQFRWILIPLVAVVLSIVLSALTRSLGEKRVVPVDNDIMAELKDPDTPSTPRDLGIVLAIGAMSLLAGASIGPEASLMAASIIIGAWTVNTFKFGAMKQIIILASVGALLVAFLGSMIMALVPLLLLLEKKQLKLKPALIIILASTVSYITIRLIDAAEAGRGGAGSVAPNMPTIQGHDFIVAVIVGFITSLIAIALTWLITYFARYTKKLDAKVPWYLSATVFGLVLGGLYLIGGPTIQFSGSLGSHLLVEQAAQYGAIALVVMILTKLLATGWSKAAGYRGGLVFPSIYIGVALGLLVGVLFPEYAGAGAMIGGIAGILTAAIGSPLMGALFVLAVLPFNETLLVALCAIAGTIAFDQLKKRISRTVKVS
ncbi:MAG: chloride channel protein [Candidatus Microsaccharimonas sp.]